MASTDPNIDLERMYEQVTAWEGDPEWARARVRVLRR